MCLFDFRQELGFSSPPSHADRFCGSPSLLSSDYRGLFPMGVKWPGRREADHSQSCSAKVKNTWSYTLIPSSIFMASFYCFTI